MSIRAKVGRQGSSIVEVQAWISKAAWLPSQQSVATWSATRWSLALRSSDTPVSCQIVSQSGAVGRDVLLPEAGTARPVRIAVQVQWPVGEVRQHHRRDQGEVADQLALRDRGGLAGGRREQDLVEVGELQLAAAHLPDALGTQPIESGDLVRGCSLRESGGRPTTGWSVRHDRRRGGLAGGRRRRPSPVAFAGGLAGGFAGGRRASRASGRSVRGRPPGFGLPLSPSAGFGARRGAALRAGPSSTGRFRRRRPPGRFGFACGVASRPSRRRRPRRPPRPWLRRNRPVARGPPSLGSFSGSKPLNAAWRTRLSRVQFENSARITTFGSTQRASRRSPLRSGGGSNGGVSRSIASRRSRNSRRVRVSMPLPTRPA